MALRNVGILPHHYAVSVRKTTTWIAEVRLLSYITLGFIIFLWDMCLNSCLVLLLYKCRKHVAHIPVHCSNFLRNRYSYDRN
jgi:hypothetical protein